MSGGENARQPRSVRLWQALAGPDALHGLRLSSSIDDFLLTTTDCIKGLLSCCSASGSHSPPAFPPAKMACATAVRPRSTLRRRMCASGAARGKQRKAMLVVTRRLQDGVMRVMRVMRVDRKSAQFAAAAGASAASHQRLMQEGATT
eukprot:355002-Rhodomonas_salina.1